jgi:hypothetical protein
VTLFWFRSMLVPSGNPAAPGGQLAWAEGRWVALRFS